MASAPFDFAPLLPAGLPAPAAKWAGLAKYSFIGGNNDPDQVPVEGLIQAVEAVLKREGRTLATYGLASGPQGYRPLREFIAAKLKRDAGIASRQQRLVDEVERLQRAGDHQDVVGDAGDAGVALQLGGDEFAQAKIALRAAGEAVGGERPALALEYGVDRIDQALDRDLVGVVIAADETVFG